MIGRCTVFTSASLLVKRYALTAAGDLSKEPAPPFARGSYRVAHFGNVRELAALVQGTGKHEALSASLPLDGSVQGSVVTARVLADHPGALARTKRHFAPPRGPGLLFVDCDDGTRELWPLLLSVMPELRESGAVWRPSGSSHIYRGDEDLTGLRGQHVYVMVADAGDAARIVKLLAARLWLAGHGSIKVSAAGGLLVRCPIDEAPSDAARLIFAGGAHTVPPLMQRRDDATVISDAEFLDTRSIPDLTADEVGSYQALVAAAKAEKEGEASQRRAEHRGREIARRVPELMQQGVSAAEAEERVGAAVDASYSGTLLADFVLTLVHEDGTHSRTTVGELLADPLRFHEADCLDPVNPEHRGGAADCRLYLTEASPIAYSLDDGGRVFRLKRARQRLVVRKGNRSELVQHLAAALCALPCLFRTDMGPVAVRPDGRQAPLTVETLMNMVGDEVDLLAPLKDRMAPTDLPRETAQLLLAALRG